MNQIWYLAKIYDFMYVDEMKIKIGYNTVMFLFFKNVKNKIS